MIAIITAILGILGGILPEVVKIWKNKIDFEREITLLKLQLESNLNLEKIRRDISEAKEVYSFAPPPTQSSVKWIDAIVYALNGLFRPLVAFYLFVFYVIAKYDMTVAMHWNEFDQGLVAGVFSFFFSNRAMRYAMGQLPLRSSSNQSNQPNNQPINQSNHQSNHQSSHQFSNQSKSNKEEESINYEIFGY